MVVQLPVDGEPTARADALMANVGQAIIAWGGDLPSYTNTGALYCYDKPRRYAECEYRTHRIFLANRDCDFISGNSPGSQRIQRRSGYCDRA